MIPPSQTFEPQHYGLAPSHPEVEALLPRLTAGEILDIGCGSGRHALLFNHHGFPVKAWDNDPNALQRLVQISEQAGCLGVSTELHDLNSHRFNGQYQAIIAVDTLMYLSPSAVGQVIADMQAATCKRGYNLIICAMHGDNSPAIDNLSFAFASGELSHYYRRWHIVHYHEQDTLWTPPNSQATPLRMATLLAQKVSVKEL